MAGQRDAIVSPMSPTPRRRLQEAGSRKGMRSVNVWLPARLHRALSQARSVDRVSINHAIREAVELWLASRKPVRHKGRRG